MTFKIKVCGMRDPANIKAVEALDPAYIGFIFYEKSPRFINTIDKEILHQISGNIKKAGVFVDAPMEIVREKINIYHLNAVQLHGKESADYCSRLKSTENVEIIKTFGVDAAFDFNVLLPYQDIADYFLFDTLTTQYGGSGKVFNWDILKAYKINKPFFLSGGIGLEHAAAIKNIEDNRLIAIDINSRFEKMPGLKDVEKIKLFIEKLSS